jgi:hypothetical protein
LELAGTLEALRTYKRHFEDDWDAFARAEADVEDPIRPQRGEIADDPLGVNEVFA